MPPRGYTTSADVAAYLGTTFTPEQDAACDRLIAAFEAHLDATIRYRWLVDGLPVYHEGPLYGPTVVLDAAPLENVVAVSVVPAVTGWPDYPLAADRDYRVLDARRAVIRVEVGWDGGPVPPYDVVTDQPVLSARGSPNRVIVAYTQPAGEAPPGDVSYASTQAVAAWFAPLLPASQTSGGSGAVAAASGVKSYQVGQELRVEYQDAASTASGGGDGMLPAPIPAPAAALLAPYGYPRGRGLVFA